MQVKVFTMRYSPEAGGFDDAEMQRFLENKRVLSVTEQFFEHEKIPTWALLVSYRDLAPPAALPRPVEARGRVDWRARVPEPDRPLFDTLRKWRNDRAKRDGKPAYVLLTNRQLAAVVERRPVSRAALEEIEGVGEARLAAFGDELIQVIAGAEVATGTAEAVDGPQ